MGRQGEKQNSEGGAARGGFSLVCLWLAKQWIQPLAKITYVGFSEKNKD